MAVRHDRIMGMGETRSAARSAKTGKVDDVKSTGETFTVVENETGRTVVVRGAGAMAESGFRLEGAVDLLKPVAEQTLGRSSESDIG